MGGVTFGFVQKKGREIERPGVSSANLSRRPKPQLIRLI
jgi:hypothetical protein